MLKLNYDKNYLLVFGLTGSYELKGFNNFFSIGQLCMIFLP